MADNVNPYAGTVQQLQQHLLEARAELAEAQRRVAGWEGAAAQDAANNASAATVANTAAKLEEWRGKLVLAKDRVAALESELATVTRARTEWDRAYVNATAQGLTGADAAKMANAAADNLELKTKLVRIGLYILGALALGGLVWAVARWWKKRK